MRRTRWSEILVSRRPSAFDRLRIASIAGNRAEPVIGDAAVCLPIVVYRAEQVGQRAQRCPTDEGAQVAHSVVLRGRQRRPRERGRRRRIVYSAIAQQVFGRELRGKIEHEIQANLIGETAATVDARPVEVPDFADTHVVNDGVFRIERSRIGLQRQVQPGEGNFASHPIAARPNEAVSCGGKDARDRKLRQVENRFHAFHQSRQFAACRVDFEWRRPRVHAGPVHKSQKPHSPTASAHGNFLRALSAWRSGANSAAFRQIVPRQRALIVAAGDSEKTSEGRSLSDRPAYAKTRTFALSLSSPRGSHRGS